MISCPNKSHPLWIQLVKEVGEKRAYTEYALNNFTLLTEEQIKNLNNKSNSGKGTLEGDDKDKRMRNDAVGFVGEINPNKTNRFESSTYGSFKHFQNNNIVETERLLVNIPENTDKGNKIMLALNGSINDTDILNETKEIISNLNEQGFEFILGDMPSSENRLGDDTFIKYLKSINAKYTIYSNGVSRLNDIDLGSEESFSKSVNTIKPGVEELFESNPELANVVYEALVPSGYTRLYRAENEKGVDSPAPSWLLEQPEVIAQKEAEGRWFYKSYEEAKYHADKFGSSAISYIDVPTDEVEKFNAKDNKFAGGYGREGREYFVSKELATDRKLFEQQKQQALQLYSQYLDSIFPDSKVKGINYHGTEYKQKFEKFDSKLAGTQTRDGLQTKGFWFTYDKNFAEDFGSNIINVLLDIKNPYYAKVELEGENIFRRVFPDQVKSVNKAIKEGYDSAFIDVEEGFSELGGVIGKTELVVFEPEQIHILSSKADIEGFKKFVSSKEKSGVEELFESNPELASIGTQQLYSQYLEQNPNGSVEQFKSWVDEFNRNNQKLNSNVQIFSNNKEGNFDSSSLKNDDLALMLFNQALGLNLTSVNQLTWDNIKDNIFFEKEDGSLGVKNLAFVGGNLLSTKRITLNNFLNQKGLFPEYKVFIGESVIYPNVFEVLEENEIIKQAIFENLFNLSGAFEQVKKELNNHSPETFVIETPHGKFSFPKRFASGFFKIASTVELLLKENQSSYIQDYLYSKRKKEEAVKDGKKVKPVITQTLTVNDTIVQNAIGLIGNSIIENAIKNNTSVKIQVFSNAEYSEDGVAGWYITTENTIYLHESMLNPQHLSEGLPLIAHELLHSVTSQSLLYDEEFSKSIRALLKIVKDKSNIKDFYGFKNEHEFLSEAFSSQEFRQLLKNTKFEGIEELSIWQKFINAILKLFGKNVKYTKKSTLVTAEEILNDIINDNQYKIQYIKSNIIDKFNTHKSLSDFITQKSQERLNQIKDVFNENPELNRIGTIQQYASYLDTIFPDSKVKDIVYHGTDKQFDKFNFNSVRKFGNSTDPNSGMFFSRDINEAAGYGDGTYKNTLKVLLNINNIKDIGDLVGSKAKEFKGKFDAVEGFEPDTMGRNIVVFEPEKIHILGSKQDIEGFKNFVSSKEKSFSKNTNNITEKETKERVESLSKLGIETNRKYTMSQILSNLEKLSYSSKDNTISSKTLQLIKSVLAFDTTITFKQNDGQDEKQLGYYNSKTGEVVIDIDSNFGQQDLLNVIVHELIHACTVRMLSVKELIDAAGEGINKTEFLSRLGIPLSLYEVVEKFDNVFQYLKDNRKELSSEYGMSNARELLAEALSNPEFATRLSLIECPKELRHSVKTVNILQNLIALFKEVLGKFFRVQDESILENIMKISSDIMVASKISERQLKQLSLRIHSRDELSYKKVLDKKKALTEKILDAIEERQEYIRDTNIDTREKIRVEIGELNNLKEAVSTANGIRSFVSYMYYEFISKEPAKEVSSGKLSILDAMHNYSIKDMVDKMVQALEKGSLEPDQYQKYNEIMSYISKMIEDYEPVMEELNIMLSLYSDSEDSKTSADLRKVEKVLSEFKKIKLLYQNELSELYLNQIDKDGKISQNETTKLAEFYNAQIAKYDLLLKKFSGDHPKRAKYETERNNLIHKRDLLKTNLHKELLHASKDVSVFNALFSNIRESRDIVLKRLRDFVDEKLRSMFPELQKVGKDAYEAFNKFTKGKSKFNETELNKRLTEVVTIGEVIFVNGEARIKEKKQIQFVDEFDLEALLNHQKLFVEEYNDAKNETDSDERNKLLKEAFERYKSMSKPVDNIREIIENKVKYFDRIYEFNENTEAKINARYSLFVRYFHLNTDKLDIPEGTELEQREFIADYYQSVLLNPSVTINMKMIKSFNLIEPDRSKFINSKFTDLTADEREYRDFLVDLYEKANQMLPEQYQQKLKLPSIRKDVTQRILDKNFKAVSQEVIQDLLLQTKMEDELYDGVKHNSIPIYYIQNLDIDQVSTDLMQSVLLFYKQALRFKKLSEALPVALSIQSNISAQSNPGLTDSLGRKILNKVTGKQLNSNTDVRKVLLDQLIDVVFYGKRNIPSEINVFGKSFRIDKAVDGLMNFAATTQLGGIKVLNHMSNFLNAEIQVFIESVGSKYFNTKDYAKVIKYATLLKDTLVKDTLNVHLPETKISRLGQLIQVIQPIQGDYFNEFGNKLTQSNVSRLLSRDNYFLMMNAGDTIPQIHMMLAILENKKVMKNEKIVSLLDALDLSNEGELDFDSIKLIDDDKNLYIDVRDMLNRSITPSILSLNQKLHGIYHSDSNIDSPLLRRHLIGRAVEMYRKFIVLGIKRRLKEVDVTNNDIEEGYHRTFLRIVNEKFVFFKNKMNAPELTEEERLNVRKAFVEYATIIFLSTFGAVLFSLGSGGEGDDDDDELMLDNAYLAMRLSSELTFFQPVVGTLDQLRIVRNPFAVNNYVNHVARFVNQFGNPMEEYERDYGFAHKGDLKLKIQAMKVLGLNPGLPPQEAITQLRAFR